MPRRAATAAACLAGVAALIALVVSAGRQDPDATPSPAEVASRVMSPFCPGLSLDECPSQQAGELRAGIETRISQGASNREIDRWLVADYGESVLARPPQAAAWLAPAGFILAGFAIIFVWLAKRSETRPGGPATGSDSVESAAPSASAASRAQMLEDLSRFAETTE